MDQSKPSLRWMSYEAIAAGLRLAPFPVDWKDKNSKEIVHESLSPIWWFLEIFPWKRLTFQNQDDTTYWYVYRSVSEI